MRIEPAFDFKPYEDKGIVRIVNPRQSAFYVSKQCMPKDIYLSTDRKTGEPIWVFLFSREDTQTTGAYDEWCKRKQEEIDRGE